MPIFLPNAQNTQVKFHKWVWEDRMHADLTTTSWKDKLKDPPFHPEEAHHSFPHTIKSPSIPG